MRYILALFLISLIATPVYAGVAINAGGTAIIKEGGTLIRAITITDDVDTGSNGWTYTVDVDDVEVASGSIAAGSSTFNITHTFPDGPLISNVVVTVVDVTTTDETVDNFSVIVQNVIPVTTIAGNNTTAINTSYSIVLTTSDPGDETIEQRTIEWGDGVSNNSLTHTYTTAGTYRIRVYIKDEDGTWMTGSKRITVTE